MSSHLEVPMVTVDEARRLTERIRLTAHSARENYAPATESADEFDGVPMFVVRGLAPDSQEVMDTGSPRSRADALHLRDYPNSYDLAAAIGAAFLYHLEVGSRTRLALPKFEALAATLGVGRDELLAEAVS